MCAKVQSQPFKISSSLESEVEMKFSSSLSISHLSGRLIFVQRPVRELHFSRLTRQVGRRMLDSFHGGGVNISILQGGGGCYVLQTLMGGGETSHPQCL